MVVEPHDDTRQRIGTALRIDHRDLRLCRTAREALGLLADLTVDLVITSLELADLPGVRVVEVIQERHPGLPVIAMTRHASMERGVAAVRAGAHEVLESPIHPALVFDAVDRALAAARERGDLDHAKSVARAGFSQMLTRSPRMLRVFDQVAAVAATDATVLVRGETGTGKELVSRAIHDHSPRASSPFIGVNCGAFAESLLESELFGHEKGSFTGAVGRRRGLFEMADGGTLFLDELGETSPSVQVALLRVLETRRFRRVGGHDEIPVDTRIVAATHAHLEDDVKGGTFREDLYYRLDVFPITLPPLRERSEDIPLLTRHFLDAAAEDYGLPSPTIPPDVMARISSHRWPGNVRQLRALCERWVISSQGEELTAADLPWSDESEPAPLQLDAPIDTSKTLHDFLKDHTVGLERAYLHRLLAEYSGHLTHTSKAAGITRRTLYTKMRSHGLDADDYRGR